MKDEGKTKEQLINELAELRRRIAELEASEAERKQAEEEIQQRTEDLALVNSLNNAVNRGNSLQKIIQLLAGETRRVFSSSGATAYLLSEDKEYLVMQNLSLPPTAVNRIEKLIGMKISVLRIPLKAGSLYLKALQAGKPQLINDPATIQSLMAEFTENKTLKKLASRIPKILDIRSAIIVPLVAEGEAIGLLDISRSEPFTESDLHRFETISGQLTAVIKRKWAEEEIRKLNQFLDSVLDNANVWLDVLDEKANVVIWNKAAEEISGYSREEVVGHSKIWEWLYLDQEYRNEILAEAVAIIEKGEEEQDAETIIRRKDGQTRIISWNSRNLVDEKGNPVGSIALGRDITERKRAEEALRIKDSAIASSINAIAIADLEGNLTYVNSSFLKLWGYNDDKEVLGRPSAKFWQMEEKAAAVVEALRDRGSWIGELVANRKDGLLFDVWLSASMVTDEAGKPICMMASFADITERKRAAEQLQQYAAELERSNEELKRFAYIISHDLRAPLTNLKGFSEELCYALEVIGSAMNMALPHLDEKQRLDVTTALQEDVPEALGFIDSSVTRMDNFISAVLKLSRLGRRELDPEPIDMNTLVQATLQTLAHQIEQRQVSVTVGSLPTAVADRTSMEQIMGNLLNNAVIYLNPDRPGRIEVTAEHDHEKTTFRVRDNGRGIAEEDMPKVFAPFRRAGKQDVQGEGMGLAYVQALVRRHGGRIRCESEPGVGTTFIFTISNYLTK